ncbi:MAG TPA: LysM peptidoglycan-binding domain-containing protein [Anaerolineales bacterium]|nr:LysM peptidoglycan-binding domain-containing protein [Anaerolineales bacterium]
MNASRQVAFGILAALVSTALLFGSLSLGMVEGQLRLAAAPSQVSPTTTPQPLTPGPSASDTAGPPPVASATLPLVMPPTGEVTLVVAPEVTVMPPNVCPVPPGWYAVTVQPGDTLASLAQDYNTTENVLAEANCLVITDLISGSILYVPAAPEPTTIPCGPPWGWVFYTVQYGDTLYKIAVLYGVRVSELQFANCLGNSTLIRVGQKLYVPNIPIIIPTIPPTWTASPSQTPLPPSVTPSPTWPVYTLTPTLPPPSSPTFTPSLTATQTPTDTSQPTGTPTQTATPEPSVTPTATQVPPSDTVVPPTNTPTDVPSETMAPPNSTPLAPVDTPIPG